MIDINNIKKYCIGSKGNHTFEELKNFFLGETKQISEENIYDSDNLEGITIPAVIYIMGYPGNKEHFLKLIENNTNSGGKNICISANVFQRKMANEKLPNFIDDVIRSSKEIDVHIINSLENLFLERSFAEENVVYDNVITKANKINAKNILKKNYRGRIINITSPKGGVGKSFISEILATYAGMIKKDNYRILLIDGNFSEGSVSQKMKESSGEMKCFDVVVDYFKTIKDQKDYKKLLYEKLKNVITINPTFYKSNIEMIGVDMLFAPKQNITTVRDIYDHTSILQDLIDFARDNYDLIIFDTSNEANIPLNDLLIEQADDIFFVGTTNLRSITNIRNYILNIGVDRTKVKFVYNDYDSRIPDFDQHEIVKTVFDEDLSDPDVKDLIENKYFVIDRNIGIEISESSEDTVFNANARYLDESERIKLMSILLRMINSVMPELVDSSKINNETHNKKQNSIMATLKKIFSK